MPTRRDLLVQTAAVGALAAGPVDAASGDAALTGVFETQADRLLGRNPLTASLLGLDSGKRAPLKHKLSPTGPDKHAAEAALSARAYDEIASTKQAGLSAAARVHRAVALYAYDLGRSAKPFDFGENGLFAAMSENAGPYVISQQMGTYSALGEFLDTQHTVTTRDDAEAFLDRLAASGSAMDGETASTRRDAGAGVMAPTYILSNALGQMDEQLKVAPERSRFVETLRRKTAEAHLEGDWAGRAQKLVAESWNPALSRQRDLLHTLQARADERAGVWRLREGDAYYAWCLRQGITTTQTPDEVHHLGVEQNGEIGARMDALLKAQGLTQGTVGERMIALGKDPRFLFPDNEAGRRQALAYLQGRIDAMRAQMSKVSALALRAPAVARRVPPQIQDGAALGYMNPAPLDHSRPAIYYLNLKSTADWPKFSIPSITYHETIPGHAWQGAYLTERDAVPTLRQILSGFNGYVEGWALYSEQLADEIGMYDDDPFGRLGYLQAQKFRAVRLVVDTGVHAKRWTREQAVTYAVAESGRTREAMTSEVDRYIGWPGQACGYKVGHTEIVRLRERARRTLGSRFNLVGFNDALITAGAVPLAVLGDVVDAWTASLQRA